MNYHWLAGLIDGEGSFNIRARKGTSPCCTLTVQLRADDRPILEEIRQKTGLGRLEDVSQSGTSAPGVRWAVTRKGDAQALVALLDKYPLRTKKRRDYATWREAVLLHSNTPRGAVTQKLIPLKTRLEEGRSYPQT